MESAVAEGIGEALNAGGGGVGRNNLGAHAVHRALNQQLADVQAGLMQGRHQPVVGRLGRQLVVVFQVGQAAHQMGKAGFPIDHAENDREKLGQHGG